MTARLTAALLLAGLVTGPGTAAAQGLADPIPAPIAEGSVRIALEPIATGLGAPLWGTAAPGLPDLLYVVDQLGRIFAVDLATGDKRVFHDVLGSVVPTGERGLLGLAFHPDYPNPPFFYTYSSEVPTGPADFSVGALDHHGVVREWTVPPGLPPQHLRALLRIEQPQANHNGGAIEFGNDGLLYVALGDGGSAADAGPGHGASGNGQDLATALGAILRIDVDGTDSANGQYGIPPDNPFVGGPGLDEVWAFGLRNPFRISVDRETGLLWIGDVGQADIEEVSIGVAGGNYGWRLKEGSFFFLFPFNAVTDQDPGLPPDLKPVDPIAEYDHDEGVAVIGGFVYRGRRIPGLSGRYVFGDLVGRLFYLDGTEVVEFAGASPAAQLHGFGRDAHGEIHALTSAGQALRIAPADEDGDGRDAPDDGCPFVFDDPPLDSGGVGAAGPDGIGDACQCGDVTADGAVTGADVTALRGFLTGAQPLAAPALCSVWDGLECDVADAAVLLRALGGSGPGVAQVCGPATSLFDTDADGVPNAVDVCPFAPDPDQADSGGPGGAVPDGVGDACQCGDLSGDGRLSAVDAVVVRVHLTGTLPPFPALSRCDSGGPSGCDVADAARIARAGAGLPPAPAPHCAAYGP